MYHFFVESSQMQDGNKTLLITGADYNHIVNVLRFKVGEELSVSTRDGDGKEYRFGIDEITQDSIICRLRFIKEDGLELPSKIFLFQGLPKADKMELIIQKAVELGTYSIIPVATRRSVVKLDEKKAEKKLIRWNEILLAATKQCNRNTLVELEPVIALKELSNYKSECNLVAYEKENDPSKHMAHYLKDNPQSITVCIGPEGGFEESEIQVLNEFGFDNCSLGKNILRAETAACYVLTAIEYQNHVEG